MDGTCSSHDENEECVHNFSRKSVGSSHLGDLGIDEKLMLKWVLKK